MDKRLWLVVLGLGLVLASSTNLLAGFDRNNIGSIEVSSGGDGCVVVYKDVNGYSFVSDGSSSSVVYPACVGSLASSCSRFVSSSCNSNYYSDGYGNYRQCYWTGSSCSSTKGVNCSVGENVVPNGFCRLDFTTKQKMVRVLINGQEVVLGLKGVVGWYPEDDSYLLKGFEFYDDPSDTVDLIVQQPIYQGSGSVDCSTLDCYFFNNGQICEPINADPVSHCDINGCCKVCYTVQKTCNAVSSGGNCVDSGIKADVDVDGWYCNSVSASNIFDSGCWGSCIPSSGSRYSFKFFDIMVNKFYGTLYGQLAESDEPSYLASQIVEGVNKWRGEVYVNPDFFQVSRSSSTTKSTTQSTVGSTTTINVMTTYATTTTLSSTSTTIVPQPNPDDGKSSLLMAFGIVWILLFVLLKRK